MKLRAENCREGQSVPEKCMVIFLTVSLYAMVTYREANENFAGVIFFFFSNILAATLPMEKKVL